MFEFTPDAVVEDLSVVPSHLKPMFTQTESGFAVNPDMRELAEAVSGLQRGLNEANKVKKGANDEAAKTRLALKALKEVAAELGMEDLGPDQLREYVGKLTSANAKGEDLKINLEKIKADHDRRVQEVVANKDGEVGKMRTTLNKYLVDNAAIAELAAEGGVPDLLLPHVRSQVKVFEDGDEYVVRVVDAQGEARSNGKGGWMTVKDLVAEMKGSNTFGLAFQARQTVGMGGKPQASARQVTTQSTEPMTPIARIARGLRKRG